MGVRMKVASILQRELQVWQILAFLSIVSASSLPSAQITGLLQLQSVLESPPILSGFYSWTDFCHLQPSDSLAIVCNAGSLTQLRIIGDKPSHSKPQNATNKLSSKFSTDTLGTTLLFFPDLQSLELVSLGMWGLLPEKVSNLNSLQVLNLSSNFFSGYVPRSYADLDSLHILALDCNILNGTFPTWLGTLPSLQSLSLSKNLLWGAIDEMNSSAFSSLQSLLLGSNYLNGSLPPSLADLQSLITLDLAQNKFSGSIPNLASLLKLQVLNVSGNSLGPDFPALGNQLVFLQMSRNSLTGSIPDELLSFSKLKMLDLSSNYFTDTPPSLLFALPSLQSLSLAENHLSGELPYNLSLGKGLASVDLSFNFFTGNLPHLLTAANGKTLDFRNNCFTMPTPKQQPELYCLYERSLYESHERKHVALVAGLIGGGVGVLLASLFLFGLLVWQCRRRHSPAVPEFTANSSQAGSSVAIPSELLSNARYLSQSMRLGVLSLPQNRVFTLEQLEEATNNFSRSALLGEGGRGKVYKGRLEDGTHVAVKCVSADPKLETRDIKAQTELLSKLRHHHLVNVIGYCLVDAAPERGQDRRLFVVSEYVDNGTLRSHIAGRDESLSWLRRLAAVIGAAKGIHYLHHGVVPSIFHHDLKITNILLDQNFVPKITDYGLPRPPPAPNNSQPNSILRKSNGYYRRRHADKMDVYNFGLVLLEIVMGRPPIVEKSQNDKPKIVEVGRLMMELCPTMDLIDSAIVGDCGAESLATVVDIAIKCLGDDASVRPSMEDVLWNLQYAVQVQDTSFADASDELFDPSSPGSGRSRKEIILRSGPLEKKLSFSRDSHDSHERKVSQEDFVHSQGYVTEFLR